MEEQSFQLIIEFHFITRFNPFLIPTGMEARWATSLFHYYQAKITRFILTPAKTNIF